MPEKRSNTEPLELIAAPAIEKRILVVRGRQVMLDEDLADLYGVNKEEVGALRSQIATSNTGRGGRRYAPYVFTEQGVAMLSSVLRSKRAIAVNIEIIRAFVELRRIASSYAVIEERLEQLERGMGEHDEQLERIFNALHRLMTPPPQPNRPIGFRVRGDDDRPGQQPAEPG